MSFLTILNACLGLLVLGGVFYVYRLILDLRTRQQAITDGLVALGKDVAELGARTDELHGKSLEALRRVVAHNGQIHESQGQLAIEYGARLAAIETLLAHSRRHWGSSLKRLYETARIELTMKATPETRIAEVPPADAPKEATMVTADEPAPFVQSDPEPDLNTYATSNG